MLHLRLSKTSEVSEKENKNVSTFGGLVDIELEKLHTSKVLKAKIKILQVFEEMEDLKDNV